MDSWREEEEEIFIHPRDPYKRVDTLQSSRQIRVLIGGETIAETKRPLLLFETGLPARFYFPKKDVQTDLLIPSKKISACPYKGKATYWSAQVNGKIFENIVWSYIRPLPECFKIKGLLAFNLDYVDDMFVDGESLEKAR